MKKVIKFIRNNTLILIIGIILGTVTIVLADTITANIVIYDTTISGKSSNTVQDAIDDLYTGLYNIGNASSSGLSLILHVPKGLSDEYEPNLVQNGKQLGLKRFQGTTADNYICFGTTNPGTCTGSPGTYMYRIIGIDANGQMKLIKNTAVSSRNWSSSTGKTWPQSTLYTDLNGSYFLTNTTYVPSGWETRIADTDWHYWTGSNVNVTAAAMASQELGAATVNAKIGLMYLHDYYYGLVGGNNCTVYGAYSTCRTSWIFLSNGWTISRYTSDLAWRVTSDGSVNISGVADTNAVRPVFFLTSNQVITGGKGTEFEPYYLR